MDGALFGNLMTTDHNKLRTRVKARYFGLSHEMMRNQSLSPKALSKPKRK